MVAARALAREYAVSPGWLLLRAGLRWAGSHMRIPLRTVNCTDLSAWTLIVEGRSGYGRRISISGSCYYARCVWRAYVVCMMTTAIAQRLIS